MLSREDVAEEFFWYIRKTYRNLEEAAQKYKVSVAFVSAVQTGKKPPNKEMLADLGLEKITGYIRT